ncbi:MAG: hypothetical protein QM687_03435 [Ferruginibacter sp.]
MSTDFKQYIIPKDPSFIPPNDVMIKVDAVLEKWGLKKDISRIVDLTKGKNAVITTPLASIEFEGGIAIEYPGIHGKKAGEIIGESYYESEPDEGIERRIESFMLIAGRDYRIHPGSGELKMTVMIPPLNELVPLEPYCKRDEILHVGMGPNLCLAKFSADFLGVDVFQYYGQHAEAYSSDQNTTPPQVDILVAEASYTKINSHFSGYWRTAFIIDFGNDLPKFENEIYTIKNRELIKDLENAFGCELIEIGHFY